MGWFKKNTAASPKTKVHMLRPKRGWRSSKKTQYVFEATVALYFGDKKLGVIPIDLRSSSKANARKAIQRNVRLVPESITRVKEK